MSLHWQIVTLTADLIAKATADFAVLSFNICDVMALISSLVNVGSKSPRGLSKTPIAVTVCVLRRIEVPIVTSVECYQRVLWYTFV